MSELPQRLTVEEAADFLQCQPDTVREKAAAGELVGAKAGKDWIFRASDVAAYFDQLIQAQQEKIAQRKSKRKPRKQSAPSLAH